MPLIAAALVAAACTGATAGTFAIEGFEAHPTGLVPEDLLTADFNGDGLLDIAISNTNALEGAGGSTESVTILLNTGGGSFAAPAEYPVGDRPEGIAAADFDEDGILDLATSDYLSSTVTILLGNEAGSTGLGDGSFRAGSTVPVAGSCRSVIAGDFDEDGDVDLATSNYKGDTVSILEGAGNGAFSVATSISVGVAPEVLAAGRFNGDPVTDLVTCDASGDTVTILAGASGSFAFTLLATVTVGDNPRFVKAADFDADGYDEILVANHLGDTVQILRTTDGAAFSTLAALSSPAVRGPIYIDTADLDGDGDLDVVVSYAKSDLVVVYPGQAGLTFGPGEQIPAGRNTLGVSVADLDGDGLADIAAANALDNNAYVYLAGVTDSFLVIDNGTTGTTPAPASAWSTSGAPNPYGTGSLYAKQVVGATYTWTAPLSSRSHAVYAWWTQLSSRNRSADYTVTHDGGTSVATVNQTADGGRWNRLGIHAFTASGSVTVTADDSSRSTCADAVAFLPLLRNDSPPTASIVSIAPDPGVAGQPVTLEGGGSDTEGAVVGYEWTSSVDGLLGYGQTLTTSGLSLGTHTITLRVQDSGGYWSPDVTRTFVVQQDSPLPDLTVIDNGQIPGTSFTGSWSPSSGAAPYGDSSLYAKNGPTYTYTFTLATAGTYQVYAWWTEYSSRSSSVPYEITHLGGTTTAVVDQRTAGGQWNLLADSSGNDQFVFGTEATVTIAAIGSASTCADAVGLLLVSADPDPNIPPTAVIDGISPNPAVSGVDDVAFTATGSDDSAVVAYEWKNATTGDILSAQEDFTLAKENLPPPGSYTIGFRVQDDEGLWSTPAEAPFEVLPQGGLRVLDNGQVGTTFTGGWNVSGGPDPYGTESLYAKDGPTYTYTFNLAEPGVYDVFAWWTEWSSRSQAVPYDITHSGGVTTITVNQRETGSGGMWNYLGTFSFDGSVVVTIRAVGFSSTCADAVAIAPPDGTPSAQIVSIAPNPSDPGQDVAFSGDGSDPDGTISAYEWSLEATGEILSTEQSFTKADLPEGTHTIRLRVQDNDGNWSPYVTEALQVGVPVEVILDNSDPDAVATAGSWNLSGGANPYGAGSVYAKYSGTYTYTFKNLTAGSYRVYGWWTTWPSRSTSVPIEIDHAGGTATVPVNQQANGGTWNLLTPDPLTFDTQAVIRVQVVGSTSTCADAFKLERVGS